MADLHTSEKSDLKKIRSKKLTSKVDLTAMVDLAFLLITFFMLTTSLSKPSSMDLTLPDNGEQTSNIDQNRTMTLLLGADNELKYYMGMLKENKVQDLAYGSAGLRKEIGRRKLQAEAYCKSIGKPDGGLIVLIKPSNKSNYRNLVDVLDEMAISDVPTYSIADLSADELLEIGNSKVADLQ